MTDAEHGTPPSSELRTTDVSVLVTGLIGLAATIALFVGVVIPLQDTVVGRMFGIGWVPKATLFLGSWSAAILIWKLLEIRRERRCLGYELLPRDIARDIRADNVERFQEHVRSMPSRCHGSFLVNRVSKGLEQFRTRQSAQEVGHLLNTQGELDAAVVDSSYTMLRVFIWAIPILGFIGTVQGIGDAVAGFSDQVNSTGDLASIKVSLGVVTSSLAFAFDTTLVALLVSMLLMLPMHWLQKLEDDLLSGITNYCSRDLLLRLDDGALQAQETAEILKGGVEEVLAEHRRALDRWAGGLTGIGARIADDLGSRWKAIDEAARARETESAKRVAEVLERAVQEQARALSESSREAARAARELHEDAGARAQALVDSFSEHARAESLRIQAALAQTAETHEKHAAASAGLFDRLQRSMVDAQDALAERAASALERAITMQTEALARGTRDATSAMRDSLELSAKEQAARAAEFGELLRATARAQAEAAEVLARIHRDVAAHAAEQASVAGAAEEGLRSSLRELEVQAGAIASAMDLAVSSFQYQMDQVLGAVSADREGLAQRLDVIATGLADGAADLGALRAALGDQAHGMQEALQALRDLEPSVRSTLDGTLTRHARALGSCAESLERATAAHAELIGGLGQVDPDRLLPERLQAMDGALRQLTSAVEGLEQHVRPRQRSFSFPFFRGNGRA